MIRFINLKFRCFSFHIVILLLAVLLSGSFSSCSDDNEIEIPNDAPQSLSPAEAVKSFQLSSGFRIELVASEPLINEPTGVCWDAKGQLYVSELHGYNLPGQKEIEAMNKTGLLDTVVQRVDAAEEYKRAAKSGIYSTIKKLTDTNGDGVMDEAAVLADKLPLVYGCTAARGGLILAGQTNVLYMADRDNDNKAEIVDTLFTGWESNDYKDFRPERGISAPIQGPDGWIYFARGTGGGLITGPNLKGPVKMPRTEFRIRADGSAIEAVTGGGGTIGHTMTEEGYWLYEHSTYGIPIQWKYLERNPNISVSPLTAKSADYATVYPIAPTHPWRLTRSNDPEWREFYLRYGEREVEASGYFTGEASPLIYRKDSMFPAEFIGNMFSCSPAHSLVHRAIVEREGTELKVRRGPESEQGKEFLASTDSWFAPTNLAQAPDGSIYIADFYQEIIEDYSAVPRPMQQKYRLDHGADMGRIWRVSPDTANPLESMEAVDLTNADLNEELDSPHYWHRKTADRLIREKKGSQAPELMQHLTKLTDLRSDTPTLEFVRTLRREDKALIADVKTARKLAQMSQDISDSLKILQLTLSLGYSSDDQVFNTLIDLAREHAGIRWMPDAIMTGVYERSDDMFKALLREPGVTGKYVLSPLAASISARGEDSDLFAALSAIVESKSEELQVASLKGINSNVKPFSLNGEGKMYLNTLLESDDPTVRQEATVLALKLDFKDSKVLDTIRKGAVVNVLNPKLTTEKRLEAVALLSDFPDELAGKTLIDAWSSATPPLKSAILEALLSSENKVSLLIEGISNKIIPVNYMNQSQRTQLLEQIDDVQHSNLEAIFAENDNEEKDKASINKPYFKALQKGEADAENGRKIYQAMCSSCHQARDIGNAVGPSLDGVFGGSKETLVRNILWPNEAITSNYELYTITTDNGEEHSGVLFSESANSVVLRQVGGIEQTFMRKNIEEMNSSQTSLMPPFRGAITPQEVADLIEWMQTL